MIGDEANLLGILFFNCGEETMRERLLKRGQTSGRVDDNEAVIVKRFNTYAKQTFPVIQHFEKTGRVYDVSKNWKNDRIKKPYFVHFLQKSLKTRKIVHSAKMKIVFDEI